MHALYSEHKSHSCTVKPGLQQLKSAQAMRACSGAAATGAWAAAQLSQELLREEVRPAVEEQIRLQADAETRVLLANLKVCLFEFGYTVVSTGFAALLLTHCLRWRRLDKACRQDWVKLHQGRHCTWA